MMLSLAKRIVDLARDLPLSDCWTTFKMAEHGQNIVEGRETARILPFVIQRFGIDRDVISAGLEVIDNVAQDRPNVSLAPLGDEIAPDGKSGVAADVFHDDFERVWRDAVPGICHEDAERNLTEHLLQHDDCRLVRIRPKVPLHFDGRIVVEELPSRKDDLCSGICDQANAVQAVCADAPFVEVNGSYHVAGRGHQKHDAAPFSWIAAGAVVNPVLEHIRPVGGFLCWRKNIRRFGLQLVVGPKAEWRQRFILACRGNCGLFAKQPRKQSHRESPHYLPDAAQLRRRGGVSSNQTLIKDAV